MCVIFVSFPKFVTRESLTGVDVFAVAWLAV